jgi:hypothetical protein
VWRFLGLNRQPVAHCHHTNGLIMTIRVSIGFTCLAFLSLGLAASPSHVDVATVDVTANLPTMRIRLIGIWQIKNGDGAGALAEFTNGGTVKICFKGGTMKASFAVTGNVIQTKYKEKDGRVQEHSFKINRLTDQELVLEENGKTIELKRK